MHQICRLVRGRQAISNRRMVELLVVQSLTELTTRDLAERVMAERRLHISAAALRNSVVFKVVQALRHAQRRKLVRMVEKRKVCASGRPVRQSRCASLPIPLPGPADKGRQGSADQAIRQAAIALKVMILKPPAWAA